VARVTLSFDNGPDPDITPRVLDVLRHRGAPAQFFVLGQHLADPAHSRLVERARDEGHVVGNHSFSHRVPLGEDPRPDAVEREIAATERLLAPLVPGPKRFRPFGGEGALGPHLLSPAAVDYLVVHNYSCILWNSVPRDWIDPHGWVARAIDDCATRPHSLVVLHDIPNACLAGLENFIDTVRDRGIEFVLEVPRDCAPIVDGRVVSDLTGLVSSAGSSAARITQ
jgi:peptidoglycan/xylan/chitin deacetylase (PgdA/CDA1 family)